MTDHKFVVSSSPHVRTKESTPRLMLYVLQALFLIALASIILFGARALAVIVVSVVAALMAEALWQKALGKPIPVHDGSAAITGLLIAFNMPPLVPLWIPVMGSVFAIIVVKQFFGGLGHNFMNPALAGRAFLVSAWPVAMTSGWQIPFDGVTSATPLEILGGSAGSLPEGWQMLVGWRAGCLGETSALVILLGGFYLIYKQVIDWKIPASFIGTVAAFAWVFGGSDGWFTGDVWTHVLSGGLLIGAFFMATDYVTSPVTKQGRLIMGFGCGLLTALIRLWGGYPEGVSYSILLMNVATPLIDSMTVPLPFGTRRTKAVG